MSRFIILFVTLLTISCSKNRDENITRYHEDGRAKPVVFINQMIDSSSYDLPWSLSDEFTTIIKSNLISRETLYIPSSNISYSKDPFGVDISWMKDSFGNTEFVVFTELVQHELTPVKKKSFNSSTNLNMAIRVRVIDLRSNPKVILQEVVKDSYYISKNLLPANYNITMWGTTDYESTPMGIAHNKVSKELIDRIYDYIMLSQGR